MNQNQKRAAIAAANAIVNLSSMLEEVLQTQAITEECRQEIELLLNETYHARARGDLIREFGLEEEV